jgi:hypothetical protein
MIATKQSIKRGTKTAQFSLSIDRSHKGVKHAARAMIWLFHATEPELAFAYSMNEGRILSLHSKYPIKYSMAWYYSIIAMQCLIAPLIESCVTRHSGTAKSGLEDYAGTATYGRGRTAMRLDIDMWSKTNQIRSRL